MYNRSWCHKSYLQDLSATLLKDLEDLEETIECLRAENERLREALCKLTRIADAVLYHDERGQGVEYGQAMKEMVKTVRECRAALKARENSDEV